MPYLFLFMFLQAILIKSVHYAKKCLLYLICKLSVLTECEGKLSPYLGPSMNGMVTGRNTKICCHGFILALFQSNTANKLDSE